MKFDVTGRRAENINFRGKKGNIATDYNSFMFIQLPISTHKGLIKLANEPTCFATMGSNFDINPETRFSSSLTACITEAL